MKFKKIYFETLGKKNFLDILILLIFISFFFVGITIFNDYGISWDEEANRNIGFISLNYIREIFNLDKYTGFEYSDKRLEKLFKK